MRVITRTSLEEATRRYVHTALRTGLAASHIGEEAPEPLDMYVMSADVPPEVVEALRADLRHFVVRNARDVLEFMRVTDRDLGHVASDFHLTRNDYGVGFWARGAGEVGERLTVAAHAYGRAELIGDVTVTSIYLDR